MLEVPALKSQVGEAGHVGLHFGITMLEVLLTNGRPRGTPEGRGQRDAVSMVPWSSRGKVNVLAIQCNERVTMGAPGVHEGK